MTPESGCVHGVATWASAPWVTGRVSVNCVARRAGQLTESAQHRGSGAKTTEEPHDGCCRERNCDTNQTGPGDQRSAEENRLYFKVKLAQAQESQGGGNRSTRHGQDGLLMMNAQVRSGCGKAHVPDGASKK